MYKVYQLYNTKTQCTNLTETDKITVRAYRETTKKKKKKKNVKKKSEKNEL